MQIQKKFNSFLRVKGLLKKEFYQIIRDPSSILIAFVLPLILLFLFSYAISLDFDKIKLGIALESDGTNAHSLLESFHNTSYFDLTVDTDRRYLEEMLVAGKLRGLVVIPSEFDREIQSLDLSSPIQIITDASETNTATLLENYVRGTIQNWQIQKKLNDGIKQKKPITTEFKLWYNQSIQSRSFLLPGSIAIIMTLIGSLLTSLVISREWERGTMEALIATPVSIMEILAGKLIPYFILGLGSMLLCVAMAVFTFHVPLRGSFILLLLISSLFLIASLSLGLLISTIARNQFIASQAALYIAFLPAFLLSGFIFEIQNMPTILQGLTYLFPPRYFVSSLKTLFLTGNVYKTFLLDCLGILAISSILIVFVAKYTKKKLD